jgi:hypothetical protein
MKKFFFLTLLIVAGCVGLEKNQDVSRAVAEQSLATSCIGPESANVFFIYLHGIDSNPPSLQELKNRAILEKVALQKNIRIAMPRASMLCPNQPNSYCWGWSFDQSELLKVIPMIIESRKVCFRADKSFGLIGFSNGGYLLTRLYSQKMISGSDLKPTLLVTSGSLIYLQILR